MTSDIELAFAHPEARARATDDGPHDRISLRDHVVEAEIGAFQSERGARQRLNFNVVVEVRPHDAAFDDDVDKILSYDTITDAIGAGLAAERLNLLETLAERIADYILAQPQAMRCFVRIEKLDRGPGALGVEIVRSAAAVPRLAEEIARDGAPHPRVVLLGAVAVASDHVGGWIDVLTADGPPPILVAAAPGAPAPRAAHPAAQRRIDLLALDQGAWVLAGRDRRCVVVATRTELDWSMRQGHLSVWAPSKIVLDAVTPPEGDGADPARLAAWFAELMQAAELVGLGVAPPPAGTVPTRQLEISAEPGFERAP